MSPEKRAVAVISDTHGLLRPGLLSALTEADLIVHAGDVGGEEVLEMLRAIAPTHAVRGNCDSASLGLAPTAVVEVEGALLYVVHDLATIDIDPGTSGIAVVISGHSHEPAMIQHNGVLYLNPGSAGPRRFRLPISMAWLHVDESAQVRAELMELEHE